MIEVYCIFYIFVTMLFISAIHIYWLKGGLWPGENYQDLVDKVLGAGDRLPSKLMFIIVIIAFILMAFFPLLSYINIKVTPYEKEVLLFLGIVFFLRSFYMFIPFIANKTTKVFQSLNKKIYAPLCFVLACGYFYLYSL